MACRPYFLRSERKVIVDNPGRLEDDGGRVGFYWHEVEEIVVFEYFPGLNPKNEQFAIHGECPLSEYLSAVDTLKRDDRTMLELTSGILKMERRPEELVLTHKPNIPKKDEFQTTVKWETASLVPIPEPPSPPLTGEVYEEITRRGYHRTPHDRGWGEFLSAAPKLIGAAVKSAEEILVAVKLVFALVDDELVDSVISDHHSIDYGKPGQETMRRTGRAMALASDPEKLRAEIERELALRS